MLKSNPSLALMAARSFWVNFKAKHIDYRFYNGKSKELSLVSFRITPLCNKRCVMCGQWGETGIYKEMDMAEESKKILPMEYYKRFIDEMEDIKPILYVWGGEPFMYPGFMDLAQYMAEKCPVFSVNTNGTFLEEEAERIVRDKWAALFVSLDGFKDINDKIRGAGTYEKVIKGIRAINKEKERQGSAQPFVGIVTAISNLNYMHLEAFARSLHDLGLSWHIINLGTYTNSNLGEQHTKFMKDNFDVDAIWWKGIANGCNEGIDGPRFAEILARVQKLRNGYPIITVPVIKADKMDTYYSGLETILRNQCLCPWVHVNIDYNGDVHFCGDYPDYVIGNLKDDSFMNIYNNDKAVRFRKTLKNSPEGIFPMCTRCYQLMLLGRKAK